MTPKQHALRIAALRALSDAVKEGTIAARGEAEQVFAAARINDGTKSLDVTLDDGTTLGSLAIKVGPTVVKVDADRLFELVERTRPKEIVEELKPGADQDADLIAWVKENRPGLLQRKVRESYQASLLKGLDEDGRVVDTSTGELVKVATITHEPPTGAFAYTPNKTANAAVMRAWREGKLAGVLGASLLPAIEAGEPSE